MRTLYHGSTYCSRRGGGGGGGEEEEEEEEVEEEAKAKEGCLTATTLHVPLGVPATRVTKAGGHHRWSRVWGWGAAVGVERCTGDAKLLATGVTKAKSHHRWSRVWERAVVGVEMMQLWGCKTWRRG
jgi:hypothetical protein